MPTRVCPRGTPNACEFMCMRFEAELTPQTETIWNIHWTITDHQ